MLNDPSGNNEENEICLYMHLVIIERNLINNEEATLESAIGKIRLALDEARGAHEETEVRWELIESALRDLRCRRLASKRPWRRRRRLPWKSPVRLDRPVGPA